MKNAGLFGFLKVGKYLILVAVLCRSVTALAGPVIVGGRLVAADDSIRKHIVGLYFVKENGGGLCTGTVLNESHILTAAHCIEGVKKGMVIFKLAFDLRQQGSIQRDEVRPIVGMTQSRDYPGAEGIRENPDYNDLAVVQFTGGLPNGFRPTPLLSRTDFFNVIKKGAIVRIAGYGVTEKDGSGSGTLRLNDVPVQSMFPKKINVVVGALGDVACSGDSGGPAFVLVNGVYHQWGVASRSNCTTLSIYNRVDHFTDVGEVRLGTLTRTETMASLF